MKIESEQLLKTLQEAKENGYTYLTKITAVDYNDHLEALYFIRNFETGKEEIVRFDLPGKNPQVQTVIDLYLAADWYERELSEMFGIKIQGRTARRLLLEKWDGKDPPLRKSFIWGKPYESMKEPVRFAKKYEDEGESK